MKLLNYADDGKVIVKVSPQNILGSRIQQKKKAGKRRHN